MEPEKKEPEKEKPLKEILLPQLKSAFEELVKKSVTAKFLGILIILWIGISISVSAFRRHNDTCHIKVPLDSYFYAKMFCPIE